MRGMTGAAHPPDNMPIDRQPRADRDFSRTEFERRRPLQLDGISVYVASPEDVLLAKLEWSKLGASNRGRRGDRSSRSPDYVATARRLPRGFPERRREAKPPAGQEKRLDEAAPKARLAGPGLGTCSASGQYDEPETKPAAKLRAEAGLFGPGAGSVLGKGSRAPASGRALRLLEAELYIPPV